MTIVVRRVMPLIALAVVLAACIRRIRVDSASSDMWFHLRMGDEFLAGWSVARPGHLGTFDSADWVPTQWLSQMAMAATEHHFGVAGVIWLAGAIHVTIILLVYVLCRGEAAPLPAALTAGMSFLALSYGLSPRPQVMSYLFVVVIVFAWLATEKDGKPRWWLVALAWVWAPIHGMWPLAFIIGTVCVVGIALNRTFDRSQLSRLAMIPVLSAVVPLLTPAGVHLYSAVLLVGGRSEYFDEWGPTDFHEPAAIALAVMLVVVVVFAVRRRQSWLFVLLLLTAAGWAVYASRTTPVAAAIAAPLVARALQSVIPQTGPMGPIERTSVAALGVASLVALTVVAGVRADDQVVPGWTDKRLDALPAGARVLDDWTSGPYYLWKHPDLSLVMHGYGDVFTDDEIERNRDIMRLSPGWDDLVADLDAEAALITTDSSLGYALAHDDRWTVVQDDEDFVFLVPSS
ncbi:hypothetical protein ASG76_09365 [Nocardioides sp. Soil774]|uniref:hypothetical protein n=1 Tax=Nocardioides sp. Soil774 TaxID=1736408 RepID=UPI000701C4A6|nr:hypothetical protein [Nocardioides sp. Soil774]KRE94617.1 hypothetical protein ASG76_09365 [Nocardioides sp. Soil774]